MKIVSFFLFLGSLFQLTAFAQESWSLKKDKNGIKVFTRKSTQYKFDEIKVESNMQGNASQLAAVLLDVNDHSEWVYKTVESKLIKTISPSELYYYTQIACPWPFENRDLVVDLNIAQNKTTKVTTIDIKNMTNYLPENKGIVRVKYSSVKWVITPINATACKVDYTITADPSGSLPAWLLNMFVSKGPYESFMKLKDQMLLPKYAQVKFPFISE